MDRAAVKFGLPYGELVVQIPGAARVVEVEPVQLSHVIVERRTSRAELISVAAYHDVPALFGREVPIVWALTAEGAPVRVTGHAAIPARDVWWDGLIESLLGRTEGGADE